MPYVFPYKKGSASAKALSLSTGFKKIKTENSKFKPQTRNGFLKKVINWGSTSLPDNVSPARVLNVPEAVKRACDKLQCFDVLKGEVSIPEYTTSREEAVGWIEKGATVVERRLLNANSGKGIILSSSADELGNAPLYTKYTKKTNEYRVHVFNGVAFDVQQKKRKLDTPDDKVNWQIRNLDGGFIFAREGISLDGLPESLVKDCVKAVQVLGLDFGAVDVIWNNHQQQHYILEVNTACGLEGTTLENYTKMFKEYYNV